MKLVVLAIAALVLQATPCRASADDFKGCDAYPPPVKKSDGTTPPNGAFGSIGSGSDVRPAPFLEGAEALASCDAALADPLLVDALWLRRAHLLQSKAYHQLVLGQPDAAIASLGESDALGLAHHDAAFAASIGVGNQALRAVALFRLDRIEEARTAVDGVGAARPYSVSTRRLRRNLDRMFDTAGGFAMPHAHGDAALEPQLYSVLFWGAMFEGDYAAAAAVAPRVSFVLTAPDSRWRSPAEVARRYSSISDRADFDGAYAYVSIVAGHPDIADRTIADANRRLEAAALMPALEPGHQLSRDEQADYNQRQNAAANGTAALSRWERVIKLRADIAGKPLDAVIAALPKVDSRTITILPDLLQRSSLPDAVARAQLDGLLLQLSRQRDAARAKNLKFDLPEVGRALPNPESAATQPRIEKLGYALFVGEGMKGFTITPREGDLVEVSFGSNQATEPLVEEAAFLSAANYVRGKGKDGFLVVASQEFRRTLTINTSSYFGGSSARSVPSGYELKLVIRPVALASLPDDLKPDDERIIRVADVSEKLGARFGAAAQH